MYTFINNSPFVSTTFGPRTDVAQYCFHLPNGDIISVVPMYTFEYESAYIPAGDDSGDWEIRRWDDSKCQHSPESVALAHLAGRTE
jgi:hypothetical protein